MNEAATIFVKWWGAMAAMYGRYGDAHDIEDKPEWEHVQQLQRGWLDALGAHTGSDPETLFDTVQLAITEVLGTTDAEISLDFDTASAILRQAVRRTAKVEAEVAHAAGTVN